MAEKKTTTKKPAANLSTSSRQEKPAAKKVANKSALSKADQSASVKTTADKFAAIKTGGKQYVVYAGQKYDFEKLAGDEGKDIIFDQVLLVANGNDVKIGEPTVSGAKVTGKVISQFKDKKVVVLKYKPKKRYRKTTGHRQQMTKIEITKIN